MMKFKIMIVALLTLGLQSTAQNQTLDNKGQWFVFYDHDYVTTAEDWVIIAKGMPQMHTGDYHLKSNGQRFYVACPQEWVRIMKEILSKVKGSPVTNVAEELALANNIPWNENITTPTENYAVKDCGPYVVEPNFRGGTGIYGMNYKGYMVLKTKPACGNPNNPKISVTPATPNAPVVISTKDTMIYAQAGSPINIKVEIKNENQIVGSGNSYSTSNSEINNSGNSTMEGGETRWSPPQNDYNYGNIEPRRGIYLSGNVDFQPGRQNNYQPNYSRPDNPGLRRIPNDGDGQPFPIRPGLRRTPNDGDGQPFPTRPGLRRIPNDGDGQPFRSNTNNGNTTTTTNGNTTNNNGRRPNNN